MARTYPDWSAERDPWAGTDYTEVNDKGKLIVVSPTLLHTNLDQPWRSIGQNVYTACMEHGIGAKQLAEMCKVSLPYAYRMLIGEKRIESLKSVLAISRALGMPLDYLLRHRGPKHYTPSELRDVKSMEFGRPLKESDL